MTTSATHRVFFALWPDAPARAALSVLAREIALESGGRPTLPDLIHLTLAFVGEQPAIRVDSLRRLAGVIRARSFVLALDWVGGFRRSRVAWLGATAPQQELLVLQRDLTDALRTKAFPVDERPYAPHLTLARHSTAVVERRLPQPVRWRVNAFALVASETAATGPVYSTLAEWPLVSA